MTNKILSGILLALLIMPVFSNNALAQISPEETLRAELSNILGTDAANAFLSDPRLKLDETVIRKGITGKGFNYFSAEFGLYKPEAMSEAMKYRTKNWKYFVKARQKYGVESYYILGILRLETFFGKYKAPRSVVNSLYSVYMLDEQRRSFALRELKQFLLIARDNSFDPFTVNGSVAGAYGIPQFIPTSVKNFAADGNGDGRIDMFNDADAIMSVARYLSMNGWGKTEASRKKAVFSYNRDNGYVNAVMAFGQAIKNEVEYR